MVDLFAVWEDEGRFQVVTFVGRMVVFQIATYYLVNRDA